VNKYGLPFVKNIEQTLIPAMTKDGKVYGFYPINKKSFSGTETSFNLPDGEIPLTSVTVDTNPVLRNQTQYMAAVWELGLPHNFRPWQGHASFVEGNPQAHRWYSMPTESWELHFAKGFLIDALINNISGTKYKEGTVPSPSAKDAKMTWQASIDYKALTGDCAFFDFNWHTVFATKSEETPLSLTVISNPAPVSPGTVSPLKASVIGIPAETANGTVFNTVRVLRLTPIKPGDYEFEFEIRSVNLSTKVKLVLTIK
jgi:hypothetical protein